MMNKVLKLMTLTSLLLVAFFGATDAAATVYNWSKYDLSFETPEDGFVVFNSPTRFEIQDGTMPDGSRAIIADLVSKHQNLIVEITVNYLYGNREIVEDMIKSFAENKTKQPNHERKHQKVQPRHKAEQEKRQQPKQEPERPARKENLYDA